jgi:parallel beta-helix repeat protein
VARRACAAAGALCAVLALTPVVRAQDVPLAVVLAKDDPAPIGGAFITGIGGWASGAEGIVASRDTLDRDPSQVILVHGESNRVAAGLNGPAPGGGTYLQLGALAVGAAGAVVFRADVQEGPARRSAIFRVEADGSGARVVSSGDPTPLGDGTTFLLDENDDATRFLVAANGSGMVAFRAKDSAGRQGLYRAASGTISRVTVAGDANPALGAPFATFGTPGIADDGAIAFFGAAAGGQKGIFRARADGTIEALAVVGAAGLGGTWTAADEPAIGPDGVVAFRATVKTGATNVRGLFVAGASGVVRLVGEGEGGPGGGTYKRFGPPTVGAGGAVAFRADMTSPAEAVVAITDAPRLVAGTGLDSGFVGRFCPSPSTEPCFGDPVFGGRGRLTFRAALTDSVVDRALFVAILETTGVRPPVVDVDCGAGQRIQTAVDQVAEGGIVRVRGLCKENVSIHAAGRLTLQAYTPPRRRRKRRPKKPPRLLAADSSRPALEVRSTAGATTIIGLAVRGGAPAVEIDGVGHVLQDVVLEPGSTVKVAGLGHTLSGLRVRKGPGPCIAVSATGTVLARNDVRRCRGDGIMVTGDGGSIAANKVVGSRGSGIVVAGGANTIVQNRASGNRAGGIVVDGQNNTLAGNRASGNRGGGFRAAPCNVDAGKNKPRLVVPACPTPAAAVLLATPDPLP